jgi:hypothetical protein
VVFRGVDEKPSAGGIRTFANVIYLIGREQIGGRPMFFEDPSGNRLEIVHRQK